MRELKEEAEINDAFPDEHVLVTSLDLIPWFADVANYVACDVVPSYMTFYQNKKIMHDVKKYF